jgi:parallel beta-helix repeat protein
VAQIYLRRASAAAVEGHAGRRRLYQEQAAGALRVASSSPRPAVARESRMLAACAEFIQSPERPPSGAGAWSEVERLPRARRRSWVTWHAAAAALASSDGVPPPSAAEEIVQALEATGEPAGELVDAVATLVLRAITRANGDRQSHQLMGLLNQLGARWPRPAVRRACRLARADGTRRRMVNGSSGSTSEMAGQLVRQVERDPGNGAIALLAASLALAQGDRASGAVVLGKVVDEGDLATTACNVLARVLSGEPADLSRVPSAPAGAPQAVQASLGLLRIVASVANGAADVPYDALIPALGVAGSASLVDLGRLLPGVCAAMGRSGSAPGAVLDLLAGAAARVAEDQVGTLARCAMAAGDRALAQTLAERALAALPDPESPARQEYAGLLAHLAVHAWRSGETAAAIRLLRRPVSLQQGLEATRDADYALAVREARGAEAEGRWAAARSAYERALILRPGDDTATRALRTRIVDPAYAGGFKTIRDALAAAENGDLILVAPGVYAEGLIVTKPVEITGHGPAGQVVIEATGADVVLFRAGTARVSNLVLRQKGGGQWYAIDVERGSPEIADCDISSESLACIGIHNGATPRVVRNRIHDGRSGGILVYKQGGGTIEDNEITGNTHAGITAREGAGPTVRRNRIHANQAGGIQVSDKSAPTIEANDIYDNQHAALSVSTGATPTIRGNRIHDGRTSGVFAYENGAGTIEDNDICGNMYSGVEVTSGATPVVRRNRIHDGRAGGLFIHTRGAALVEDNEVYANTLSNVEVRDAGSEPVVRGNTIRDGRSYGIYVHGEAKGTIERNTVAGNVGANVCVSDGADPLVRDNRVHDSKGAGVFVYAKGRGTFEGNEIERSAYAQVEVREGGTAVVRRNKLTGGKTAGIYVHGGGGGTFEDNEITASGMNGVEVGENAEPVLRRNTIADSKAAGVHVHSRGKGLFEENVIRGNLNAGFSVSTGADPVVRGNRLHDGQGAGIVVYLQGRGTFERNSVARCRLAGIEIRENSDPMLKGNTFADGQGAGVFVHTEGRGTFLENEICGNKLSGVEVREGGNPVMRRNRIKDNGGPGVYAHKTGGGIFEANTLSGNTGGAWNIAEDSAGRVTRTGN